MPVDLQSYAVIGDKPLSPNKLLVDLRKIVDLLNKVEARGVSHEAQITNVQQIVQTTVMSGGMAPPAPIGPFPPLVVSATGALSGDGSATGPLAVRVDGSTVQINGSNQLEVIAGASGITQLTGDVTAGPGTGSVVATLAASGVAASTYGSATVVPVFTVDAKGRVTAVTNTGITGLLSGLTTPRVPYATAANTLADNAAFNWDNANTRLFVPTIVGGTGTTDDLIFQTTSGVGTTGSWMFFKVGNNGAVTAVEINDVGGVGIGTTGLVTVDTALVVRKANPPDIGYVAKFLSNLTSYVQIKTGTGANEQAGFSLIQNTNTFEWRVAVIGNDGNALRFGAGTGGTDVKAYITQNGNWILDSTRSEPATGTKSIILGDGTVPATMASNTAGLYANDVGGTVELFAINEAGAATQLTGGSLISGLTATRVPFASSATVLIDSASMTFLSGSSRLVLAQGGQTLDGSALSPQLHIGGDTPNPAAITMDGYGQQPIINMRRAGGTQASKTAVAIDNPIFNLQALGWDGSAYASSGILRVAAAEAWSGTAHGAYFTVLLTAPASAAAPTEVFRVTGRGNLTLAAALSEPTTGTFGMFFADGTVPATLVSNTAGLYANDVGGTVNMFAINEAGESNQLSGDIKIASGKFFITQAAGFMIKGVTSWTNGAGALTGTLTNSPVTGNPTKWIPVDDNGTTRYIPAW